MTEFLKKFKQQISEFWVNLDKTQKKRLYITTAVVVISIAAAIILLTRPSYVTLISNADSKQIAEMKKILDENKIWNSVDDDGQSLIVYQKDKGKARIAVSDKGYPKYGLTFEDAISMIGISTTESDKKHIWKHQEKSEIEAMLMSYDNVEYAEVILALPEKTLFSISDEKQSGPRAIVRITPREKLSQNQIQGIVMLVARSVVDLEPENITVVDNFSNILNVDTEGDSIYLANTQEKMRRDMELHLQRKVYDYFNVGEFDSFDTIRVVTNTVLDFDTMKKQTKLLNNPEGMEEGALINSDTLKEKVENGMAGGEPGAGSNPGNTNSPSYQIDGSGSSNYSKSHEIKSFEYNETVTEQEKATGKLVPELSTMAISLWYGQRVIDDSKLSDEFLNQIRVAASTATGIPVDNISVNKMKLAPPEVPKEPQAITINELVSSYGIFVILLAIVISLTIILLGRRRRRKTTNMSMLQTSSGMVTNNIVSEIQEEELPEIDITEKSEVKKQIEKFVKNKPEAVAQLLKNWLSDGWDD